MSRKSIQRGMAYVLVKLAFISFASGVFITTFHSAREKSQDMQGIRNLRQLGATAQLYAAANADKVVLFYEPSEWAGHKYSTLRVVFADGHTKFIPADKWPKIAIRSGISPYTQQRLRQPWDRFWGEAMLLFSFEALVASAVFAASSLLMRR